MGRNIIAKEGPGGLLTGFGPTAVGYLIQGGASEYWNPIEERDSERERDGERTVLEVVRMEILGEALSYHRKLSDDFRYFLSIHKRVPVSVKSLPLQSAGSLSLMNLLTAARITFWLCVPFFVSILTIQISPFLPASFLRVLLLRSRKEDRSGIGWISRGCSKE